MPKRGRPPTLTVKIKDMTREQRRAYDRTAQRKHYVRRGRIIDVGSSRVCKSCEKAFERTEENFYKSPASRHGLSTRCKTCNKKYSAAYGIRAKYNGTQAEYDAVMRDARCAICGTGGKLVMDHCHDRGHVRGILCSPCNTGLGMFRDNTDALLRAVEYLNATKDPAAPLQVTKAA